MFDPPSKSTDSGEERALFRVRAPGRINLIGEHVDYQGGIVLPVAIDRHITGTFQALDNPLIRLRSEDGNREAFECRLSDLAPRSGPSAWTNYVIGVVAVYRDAGVPCPGFAARFSADLPAGAGLSSSAALETVTALAVERLADVELGPTERARLCQRAEHTYAGVPCGIMDQLAVGAARAGHALMIDCRDLATTDVPLPADLAIVVADSGARHALADGEYRERRADCESAAETLGVAALRDADEARIEAAREQLGDRRMKRARHVVREIARVPAFAAALREVDHAALGHIMRGSHESLRDDFEVSCPELDFLVEAAHEFGAARGLVGSRMTGGGFGGSTVNLVRRDAAQAFIRHLETAHRQHLDSPPNIFAVHAAGGAGAAP